MEIPCAICDEPVENNPGFELARRNVARHGIRIAPWWHVVVGDAEDESDHEAIPDPEFIYAVLRHPSTQDRQREIAEGRRSQ